MGPSPAKGGPPAYRAPQPQAPRVMGGVQLPVVTPAGLPRGDRMVGPLGPHRRTPEEMSKLAGLRQRLEGTQQSGSSVVLSDGTQPRQPIEPTIPDPDITPSDADPTPPAETTPEEEQEETKAADKKQPISSDQTPLQRVASSGPELYAFPAMAYDTEYVDDILWRASPERRRHVEAHSCKEIQADSLTTTFEITQEVLIWEKPKPLWANFRTMAADDRDLVQRVMDEDYGGSQQLTAVGAMITTVAAGLKSIGDLRLPELPSILKSDLANRLEAMRKRVLSVRRLPDPLMVDLVINYGWFVQRVIKFNRTRLGNG